MQVLFVPLFSTSLTAHAQTAFRKLTFTTLRNPEPGYYLVEPNASDSIGFLDNSGFSICKIYIGVHTNVQTHDNTYITHFVPSLNGNPYFLRRDRFLSVIDTMRSTATYRVDFHEGKVWSDTTYLVLASENRIMNLSGIVQGGSASASVIGAVIQERRFSDGVVLFEWKSLDHIPVTDATDDIKLTDNLIDYIHVNSVSKDVDGNLIVSCRHTDEVIKIRKSTGEVLWRLGGSDSKGNQFTFINDTFNNFFGFSHQHSAVRTKSSNILLFDNGNHRPFPNYARAVEYVLDTVAMTATRVWSWQPADGAIEVSTTPTLGWTAAVAAERYDVQVSTSSSFNTIQHSATTANLETTLPLLQESSVLHWRVRKNDSRGAGPWSKSARFTVVMGVPTLLAPVMEDDTVAVLPHSEFRWIPGAGSPKSRLQIIAVGSSVATVDTILDQPVFTPGSLLRPNTWYRWSVRGWVDDVNGRSSTPATFITAVASPRLRGPGSNATGVPPVKSTFSWDTVAGAVSYTVMVRNADDNSLVGVYESTAEKVDVRNLPASTALLWTCRGNSEYGPGPYAATFKFTTAASSKLPAPLTVAPRGGVEVDTTSVTLQWSSVDGATVYDVQYSTSPVFADNVTSLFDHYDTQARIGPLRSATAIYWRVLARSDFSVGTWSDTAVFVTEAPPGSGLMPLSPATGSLDVPVQGSVTYTTSSMYSSYRVEFSKEPTFDPIVSTFLSTSGTCSYKDLNRETTYFWRVRGLRGGSSQDVGSSSFFTTLRKDVVSVDEQQSQQTCRVWGDGSTLHVEHSDETVSLLTVDVFDINGRCVQRSTSQRPRASMILDHVSASQVLIVLVTTDRGYRSTVLLQW